MPRRKPAPHLEYWSGPVRRDTAFKTVLVFCVQPRCRHVGRIRIADLPDSDWHDISARLKCTACGSVGYVSTMVDWTEVIDFTKPSNP